MLKVLLPYLLHDNSNFQICMAITISIFSGINDTVLKHHHRIANIEAENEKQYLNVTLLRTNVEGNILAQL